MTVLTWYAGRANAKISAYLLVFHEENDGWESLLSELKSSRLDWFSLNRVIFLIYLGLGILAIVIPWSIHHSQAISTWHKFLLLITGAWFLFDLILLMRGYPRQDYKDKWIYVKSKLHNQAHAAEIKSGEAD